MNPVEAKRLLIVEDDLYLREAFCMMLQDAGYDVAEASNGAETMAAVQQCKPDLILLDLGLPDGNGLDIARQIKAQPRTADVIIVALTGRVGAEERALCLEAGCAAYFAKPISPRELLKKLPELLKRP